MLQKRKWLTVVCALILALSTAACNRAVHIGLKTDAPPEEAEVEVDPGYGFYQTGIDTTPGLRVKVFAADGVKNLCIQSMPDDDGAVARKGDFLAVEIQNLNPRSTCPLMVRVADSAGQILYAANTTGYVYGVSETGRVSALNIGYSHVWLGASTTKQTVLIDYKNLCDSWTATTVTKKQLADVATVYLGFSSSTNINQEAAITRVYTVKVEDCLFDSSVPGFVNHEGFTLDANAMLANGVLDVIADFTEFDQDATFETLENVSFSTDDYTNALLVTLNGYAIKQPRITNSLENAVEFSMDRNGNVTSSDSNDPHYSADLFAYVTLWEAPTPEGVAAHSGVAVKLRAMGQLTPFRLVFYDAIDNEVFYTGRAVGETERERVAYPFYDDDGGDMVIYSYWNCVWAKERVGTLYFPYGDLSHDDTANGNAGATAGSNGKLDKIAKIELAMDTASEYALEYAIVIGTLCDIDNATETMTLFCNTADYGDQEIDLDDPTASGVVKPSSEAFKNQNWIYKRMSAEAALTRGALKTADYGDVKLLEDFSLPSRLSEQDAAAFAAYLWPKQGQPSTFTVTEDATLAWTVGDASNGVSTLTVLSGAGAAIDEWFDWSGAKGLSLYIKNPGRATFVGVAFEQARVDGTTVRWSITPSSQRVYAYDIIKDKQLTLIAADGIYLPAGFEGYIRLPFAAFTTETEDAVFSTLAAPLGIYLTADAKYSSGMTFTVDEIGLYYRDFTVGSTFDKGLTIKDAMTSEYLGD